MQGRDIRRRPASRPRGLKQQLAGQRFVVVGVVDQKVDQLALRKRQEMRPGVIEGRCGFVMLPQPSESDRDTVLAEGRLASLGLSI